jgi:hypothetical protein
MSAIPPLQNQEDRRVLSADYTDDTDLKAGDRVEFETLLFCLPICVICVICG